jgi:Protein of unknown function (DUF1275)
MNEYVDHGSWIAGAGSARGGRRRRRRVGGRGVGAPVDGTVELAGPERFRLDELARRVDADGGARRYVVIGLLAAGLGLQNATVRRLAVPDVTTTVLTLTLTGLAADSWFAGGHSPRAGRRVAAVGLMFTGALVGALLLRVDVALPVLAAAVTVALAAVALWFGR